VGVWLSKCVHSHFTCAAFGFVTLQVVGSVDPKSTACCVKQQITSANQDTAHFAQRARLNKETCADNFDSGLVVNL